MPELPDVEVFRRRVASTSLHRRIEHVRVRDDDILEGVTRQKLSAGLRARELTGTRRHGKYLGVSTDAGPWLVLHFGMTGYVQPDRTDDDEPEHAKVVLEFADAGRLCYVNMRKLGLATLTPDFKRFVEDKGLGPDAASLSADGLATLLAGRHGAVKPALMDQELIAGLGNVYTDEILFHARLRPERRADHLERQQVQAIHRALRRVVDKAIEVGAQPDRMPRTWIVPRRNGDADCPRCGKPLRISRVGGRSTYACPNCQT